MTQQAMTPEEARAFAELIKRLDREVPEAAVVGVSKNERGSLHLILDYPENAWDVVKSVARSIADVQEELGIFFNIN